MSVWLPLDRNTHTQRTSHNKEQEDHDECVAKVEKVGEGPSDGRLVDKVMDGEEKEVEGCGTRGEEGPPPPTVVLGAEVEVAEEDGRLGTDDDQHKEGQHDESKHVVHLTRPVIIVGHNIVGFHSKGGQTFKFA